MRVALVVIAVLALLALGASPAVRDALAELAARVDPLSFVLLYAAAAVLLLPGSILTVAAGAAYGLAKGALLAWLGAVAGSAAAFLFARHLAREPARRRLGADPRAAALERALGEGGWRIVLLTRLSPLFPYNAQNYLYGILPIGFWEYLAASAIGMVPGTFLYVYLGSAAAGAGGGSAVRRIGWLIGLLATAGVALYATRLAKRALEREIEEPRSS